MSSAEKSQDHMKVIETLIPDVFRLEVKPYKDDRGAFERSFCSESLSVSGIEFDIKQGNVSTNRQVHTLRGFHYQDGSEGESKILCCVAGRILNVVLDLRKSSTSFLKFYNIELRAEDGISLLVPSGCANAYLTLEDTTVVHYYMDKVYQPDTGNFKGLRFDDPIIGFQWPAQPAVISQRDASFPDFRL